MSTEHFEELNDQQIVRREKMTALAEQGIDPFGKRFDRSTNSAELKAQYEDKEKEELEELAQTATIAGRIMTKRGKGKQVLLISKTAKDKFRFTFVRMTLAKKTMKSSKKQTLETLLVSKVIS